jgi:hypothetical protein
MICSMKYNMFDDILSDMFYEYNMFDDILCDMFDEI